MGVFARLFRRSKTEEAARTSQAESDRATSGPGTDGEAATGDPQGSVEGQETAGPAAEKTGEITGGASVDIPKQQSSESAGSEAGEGART